MLAAAVARNGRRCSTDCYSREAKRQPTHNFQVMWKTCSPNGLNL